MIFFYLFIYIFLGGVGLYFFFLIYISENDFVKGEEHFLNLFLFHLLIHFCVCLFFACLLGFFSMFCFVSFCIFIHSFFLFYFVLFCLFEFFFLFSFCIFSLDWITLISIGGWGWWYSYVDMYVFFVFFFRCVCGIPPPPYILFCFIVGYPRVISSSCDK
jgi:hypothetical protein